MSAILLVLLTSTSSVVESGGPPRAPLSVGMPPDMSEADLHRMFVRDRLRLIYEEESLREVRVRLPGDDVFMEAGVTGGYSVVHDIDGRTEELSWVEFFELTGDQAEAARRSRNAVLTNIAVSGGAVLIGGSILTTIFVDRDDVRLSMLGVAGGGLVSLMLGFVLSDGAPEHEEVKSRIERYNRSRSAQK